MSQHAHIRTCVACGSRGEKHEFVRIVRTTDGQVCLDATGKLAGRGAYVCYNADCFERSITRRSFSAKLRAAVLEDDLAKLKQDFYALLATSDVDNSRDGE